MGVVNLVRRENLSIRFGDAFVRTFSLLDALGVPVLPIVSEGATAVMVVANRFSFNQVNPSSIEGAVISDDVLVTGVAFDFVAGSDLNLAKGMYEYMVRVVDSEGKAFSIYTGTFEVLAGFEVSSPAPPPPPPPPPVMVINITQVDIEEIDALLYFDVENESDNVDSYALFNDLNQIIGQVLKEERVFTVASEELNGVTFVVIKALDIESNTLSTSEPFELQ
jgi:hypothetical protein